MENNVRKRMCIYMYNWVTKKKKNQFPINQKKVREKTRVEFAKLKGYVYFFPSSLILFY